MSADPYKYFRLEAHELLEQMGRGVLDLEKGPASADLVLQLLRAAHTLKGAARVVKQHAVAELAHKVEDALAPLRDDGIQISRDRVDVMLRFLDAIQGHLAALTPAASGAPSPPDEAFRMVRADVAEMDVLLDGLAEAGVQLASLRRTAGNLERARHLAALLAEQLRWRSRPAANDALFPKALSVAEELHAVVNGLERGLLAGIEQSAREIEQVHDTAGRLRLLPAAILFAPLERAVRDDARSLDKRVDFQTRGGDLRLETHVLAAVQGALLQMVRNAVVHGIEAGPVRARLGKPTTGKIAVEVQRRGTQVAFICSDDGRGVDLEAVRRAAEKKGMLTTEARALDATGLLRLLLKGGLTTSDALTELSGRGVGLDVVRATASRLDGDVYVRSEAASGTTVELLVPVSFSSTRALAVEIGGISAAIPLDAVRAVVRVREEEIVRSSQGERIFYQDTALPFAPLAALLGVGETSPAAWSALILDGAAVGVERILGVENVGVRPLPALAPPHPLIAGASLDAAGNPQVVLQPEELVKAAIHGRPLVRQESTPLSGSMARAVLVVDDSLTTRMLERSILESAGYEVDLAVSGEEGLDKARSRRFDAFLVDIEMPGMDGFTFVETARLDPNLRPIPAILVTSRASPEDRRRGLEAGAQGYIVKGEFDQRELLETIHRLAG